MNKIIFIILIVSNIYSTFEWCESKDVDISKCNSQNAGYDGYACYISYDEGKEQNKSCVTHHSDINILKAYNNIFITGYHKEHLSKTKFYQKNLDTIKITIIESKSNTIKNELIRKLVPLNETDKNIIKGSNTCGYISLGRYIDNIDKYPNGYPNIEDKNICFKVDQFDDLKNLIDCGYAEIKFYISSKETKTIKTCFYIPNENLPQILVDNLFGFQHYVYDLYAKIYLGDRNLTITESDLSYEVIVEDQNGRKVKYNSLGIMEVLEKERKIESNNNYNNTGSSDLLKVSSLIFLLLFLLL